MNAAHLAFTKALNQFYKEYRALWELDHTMEGIEILDADNKEESVLIFLRKGKKPRDFLVICCNFTPVERQNVRVGVPFRGLYEEVWNTELERLGGTWTKGQEDFNTETIEKHKQAYSIEVILPALSVIAIAPKYVYGAAKK